MRPSATIAAGSQPSIGNRLPVLLAGDHLFYGPCDFMGKLTGLKTHSPAVHIEISLGAANGTSVGSRNGLGVNLYPHRSAQLIAVLEPRQTINIAKALGWFNNRFDSVGEGVRGRPYGWLDLLRFFNIRLNSPGWICSEFACLFDIAGDFKPFADEYDPGSLSPGDYFTSAAFKWKWVDPKARKGIARI